MKARLGIIWELKAKDSKMQEIARKLNLTDTETCRQLQRLSEAQFIQKQPDATYKLTSYAKLILDTSSQLNFLYKFRGYFIDHDASLLPYEFVNRLGELSFGEYCGDTLATLNRVRKMVCDADEYIWAMSEQTESSHIQPTKEKVAKGLVLKFIMSKKLADALKNSREAELLKGSRYIERTNVTLLITEKEGVIHFRKLNGQMDYVGFFGNDPKFRKWLKDLFTYYWEGAEHWYPNVKI